MSIQLKEVNECTLQVERADLKRLAPLLEGELRDVADYALTHARYDTIWLNLPDAAAAERVKVIARG